LDKIDEGLALVSDVIDEIIEEISSLFAKFANSMIENQETFAVLKFLAIFWMLYAIFQMIPSSTFRLFELT